MLAQLAPCPPPHPHTRRRPPPRLPPPQRIEDPIGLLPPKLILGINKRGVHFFRPVPKEYLHSAELRDIMQFGSSSQVRRAGGLGRWAGGWLRFRGTGCMVREQGSWRPASPRAGSASAARPAHPPSCPASTCLAQAVFFKMRVAGVLHIFQFETKQGEDICMALQARTVPPASADLSAGLRLHGCCCWPLLQGTDLVPVCLRSASLPLRRPTSTTS